MGMKLVKHHPCTHTYTGMGMKLVKTLKVDASCHAVFFVFLPFSWLLLEFFVPTHSGLPLRDLISGNDVIIYTTVEFINNMTSMYMYIHVGGRKKVTVGERGERWKKEELGVREGRREREREKGEEKDRERRVEGGEGRLHVWCFLAQILL